MFDIRDFLTGFADGAVRAFGKPTDTPVLVRRPDGKKHVALIREGYSVAEVPGAERHRRLHVFHDVDSFAAWLNRHAVGEETEILVGETKAVASLGTGEADSDLLTCTLDLHPRAARWLRQLGAQLTQRDFHRFIIGASEDFCQAASAAGQDLGSFGPFLAGQVAKLEVVSEGSLVVQLDEHGNVRFAGANDKTEVKGHLPKSFRIRVPIHLGVQRLRDGSPAGEATYELEILLRLVTRKDAAPYFVIECPQLEVVRRQALQDAVAWLRHQLDPSFLVGLGEIRLERVPA